LNDMIESEPLKVGKFQYFLAGLSFVPLLGFLVGIILLPVSIFSKKKGSNRIAVITASGLLLWVLVFVLYTPTDPTENIRPIVLENGNAIYPLSEGNMYFSSEDSTAYSFKYQTAVDINNKVKLKEEAELVWILLQSKVDEKNYKLATLSAAAPKIKKSVATAAVFYVLEFGNFAIFTELNAIRPFLFKLISQYHL